MLTATICELMQDEAPDLTEMKWMLLSEDGRHHWLGRARDPSTADLDAAASTMDSLGLAAWLAVARGQYWMPGDMELLIVRRLTQRDADRHAALALWHQARAEGLAS